MITHYQLICLQQHRRRYAYFQKTLHFAIFAPILIVMLNQRILLPQYKNSLPKAQTTAFKNSLLKIGCPEVYIRVHFRTRVFARQKHRCCVEPRTSLSALEVLGAYRTDCSVYFQKILDRHVTGNIITRHSTLDTRHSTLDTRHSTLDTRHSTSLFFSSKKQRKQYIYILTDTQKRTIGFFYPFVRFFVYGRFVRAFRRVMSEISI